MKDTSDNKVRANRANARASTGPKTTQGRTRSARNALRHALSLPVYSDPALSEEVQALAREIAGIDANAELQELARRVAEAQIDLRRVRDARHQLLSRAPSNPSYEARANVREKLAVLRHLLRHDAPDVPLTGLVKYLTTTPEGAAQVGDDFIARGSTALGLGPVRTAGALATQVCHPRLRFGTTIRKQIVVTSFCYY